MLAGISETVMRRHSRKKRTPTPYTILIYNALNTKPPRRPEGGGKFRDPSGFAALRIDMNCVVSHNIKRRKRLLKQICRYSVGNLSTPAMTYANLSDRYGSIPLCERQPENRSRIPFRQQRKRIRPTPKNKFKLLRMCRIYKKKRQLPKGNTPLRHTVGESWQKAGFLDLFCL